MILKLNIEALRNTVKKIKPGLVTNFIGFCWRKNIFAAKQDEFLILNRFGKKNKDPKLRFDKKTVISYELKSYEAFMRRLLS